MLLFSFLLPAKSTLWISASYAQAMKKKWIKASE